MYCEQKKDNSIKTLSNSNKKEYASNHMGHEMKKERKSL